MQGLFKLLLLGWLLSAGSAAWAELRVFACEPEWAALATAIGGERVTVITATTAYQDPHRIEARPSLIARLRRADLLICSGAELEAGWLPLLLRQAANAAVLPGRAGYFEASAQVERLDIPAQLDRSQGDVHGAGNPHVHLDPRRLARIAQLLHERMIALDPAGAEAYRQQHAAFAHRWQQALVEWEARARPLRGERFVTHHQDWSYLFDWLGLENAGTLEPRPGLPTSVGHLVRLQQVLAQQPARAILHSAYQSPRAARRLGEMSALPVVELPYTVGGAEGAGDLFGLFELTLERLLGVLP